MRRRDITLGCLVAIAILFAVSRYGNGPHVVPVPGPKTSVVVLPTLRPVEPDPTPEAVEVSRETKQKVSPVSPPDLPDIPRPAKPDQPLQRIEPSLPPGPTGLITIPSGPFGPADNVVVDLGALSEMPVVKYQAKPVYPAEARKAAREGIVEVSFIVDSDGRVRNATALRSSSREFEASAVEAVGKWTFKPGKKDGRAVFTRMEVPIVFSLRAND